MRLAATLLPPLLVLALLSSSAQAREVAAPNWSEMSPARQQVLAPLAAEWDAYPLKQKQHLVALADKYPTLKPEERTRIDTRLKHWAAMSKEDRIRARNNYRKVQKLPPEQRAAIKRQLKQSHASKPAGKTKPTATQPASPAQTTSPSAASGSAIPAH